jgi:hypothetical protein
MSLSAGGPESSEKKNGFSDFSIRRMGSFRPAAWAAEGLSVDRLFHFDAEGGRIASPNT